MPRTPISNDGDRNASSRREDSQSFGSSPQERKHRMPLPNTSVPAVSRTGIQPVPAASRPEVRPMSNSDYSNKERAMRPLSGDERAEARGCNVIMNKAEIITRRIMSCISPEDPEVDHVRKRHLKFTFIDTCICFLNGLLCL